MSRGVVTRLVTFFFFQAEDGIRDYKVTGVQTCALPIFPSMATSKTVAATASFTPDDRQRQAIEHVHGPMLVVAGAGTGKTTVLIRRIEIGRASCRERV